MKDITARIRVGLYRFGVIDRLRILFTGRVFVATLNAKAHTEVILTTRRPKDRQKDHG